MKEIDISGYARYCFGANYSPYVTQMGYTMAWGFHRETAFSVESIVLKNITVEVKAKHVCDLKSKGNLICASVVTPNDIFMPVSDFLNNTFKNCIKICKLRVQ